MKSSTPGGSLFPAKADPREVHVHNRIVISLLITTLGFRQAGNTNEGMTAMPYHGDHGIEIIEDGTPMNENTGAGKMFVDELLDGAIPYCPD